MDGQRAQLPRPTNTVVAYRTPGTPYQWQERAPLYRPRGGADDCAGGFYLSIFLNFTHPFSRESGLTGFAQGLVHQFQGAPTALQLFFSSHILTLFTLLAVAYPQSPLPLRRTSAIRHHEHDQAWSLTDLAKYTKTYHAQNSAPSQTFTTSFTASRRSPKASLPTTHTRAFSVPIGIATTRGDGGTPTTANSAPHAKIGVPTRMAGDIE